MTFARDLSDMRAEGHPYYKPIKGVEQFAVGWLDRDGFEVAAPSVEFLTKLTEWIALQKFSWAYPGWYACNVPTCAFTFEQPNWEATGSGEIYVPHLSRPRTLLCAPKLVRHYVAVHQYAPPKEFVDAVVNTPTDRIPKLDYVVHEQRPDGFVVRGEWMWLNGPT